MRLAGPLIDRRAEAKAADKALKRAGLDLPPNAHVGALTGEKTLVAVARALDRGARILFVDEASRR